jgi:DNA repair protein RadC
MSDKPHYHGHRQRLRQRLLKDSCQLADYEVLELLLGHVLTRQDTKPLAKALLARFGNLRGVFAAQEAELLDTPGFGPALAAYFKLLREVWARMHESELPRRQVFESPTSVAEAAKARLGSMRVEEFWVALLDNQNRLLGWERLSRGTVNEAPAYPREILSLALRHQASGIILVHNHPGGDPTPSTQDVDLTRRVGRAAQDLSIRLLDHLVVTADGYVSFSDRGLL